ncbi:hypothetical protein J6590_062987 [Homalodisca vitripennis]|nr:hypothetical protein J6590_062987 [Homalodisca vitripennis]
MMESDTDQGLEIPLSKKRKWGVHNNDKYKRNIIKKARLSGEPYRNYKGAEVPGKVLGKNSCECHRNCLDKIPKDDQVQMFLELYSIDNKNQQDSFLQGLMEIKAIKRSRPKPGIPAEKTKETMTMKNKDRKKLKISELYYLEMNEGTVKGSERINGLVSSTFPLMKPNVVHIPYPSERAHNGKNLINEKKIEDIKKVQKYIPEEAKSFYDTIIAWPTTRQDDLD